MNIQNRFYSYFYFSPCHIALFFNQYRLTSAQNPYSSASNPYHEHLTTSVSADLYKRSKSLHISWFSLTPALSHFNWPIRNPKIQKQLFLSVHPCQNFSAIKQSRNGLELNYSLAITGNMFTVNQNLLHQLEVRDFVYSLPFPPSSSNVPWLSVLLLLLRFAANTIPGVMGRCFVDWADSFEGDDRRFNKMIKIMMLKIYFFTTLSLSSMTSNI